MSVKCNLKKIRAERHIQQDELANAIMTDGRTISRYETGERRPNLEMALRLSAYFHIPINDIFELKQ